MVQGSWFLVSGLWFMVHGLGLRVLGLGHGSGFRVDLGGFEDWLFLCLHVSD